MQNEETQSLVGQKVLYNSRSCKVVADDRHTRALKKNWDLIIVDEAVLSEHMKVFLCDPKLIIQVESVNAESHIESNS